MRIVQALWPAIMMTGHACGLVVHREAIDLLPFLVFSGWFFCALLLDPAWKRSWWICLTPVALSAIAGLVCFAGLAHMMLFPDHEYWANANQPGALAIIAGLFFLIPACLLLWHLLAIRHRFKGNANT